MRRFGASPPKLDSSLRALKGRATRRPKRSETMRIARFRGVSRPTLDSSSLAPKVRARKFVHFLVGHLQKKTIRSQTEINMHEGKNEAKHRNKNDTFSAQIPTKTILQFASVDGASEKIWILSRRASAKYLDTYSKWKNLHESQNTAKERTWKWHVFVTLPDQIKLSPRALKARVRKLDIFTPGVRKNTSIRYQNGKPYTKPKRGKTVHAKSDAPPDQNESIPRATKARPRKFGYFDFSSDISKKRSCVLKMKKTRTVAKMRQNNALKNGTFLARIPTKIRFYFASAEGTSEKIWTV